MTEGNPSNILVIKHSALGDVVIATAGFKAIRAQHPQARIHCLTTKAYADLLAQSPYFDEIWIDSKPKLRNYRGVWRLRAMLRSKPWAWVYDLQTSGRSTRYAFLLARPWPKLSSLNRFASHCCQTPARKMQHALTKLRLQLAMTGITEVGNPDVSWLHGDISELRELIGTTRTVPLEEHLNSCALLVPGGSAHRPQKCWPVAYYAQLAQALAERGMRPVLLGTSIEAEQLDTIATQVPAAINLCGRTSIAQLVTLAREATIVIGNDTGPTHAMAATNRPCLVLSGGTSSPAISAPTGNGVSVLYEKNLADLTVARVLETVQSMVSSEW